MAPNVLLIILDSVRARNTGLHDHVHDTTPFLSKFAAESATWYEQARAPGARSITSHASIFTGLHVDEHGVTSADRKLQPGTTVFEKLRHEHDFETGVFSENVWITDVDIGLKEGFETVIGPQNLPFPDALDARAFVAREGRGQYRRFLRESLNRDDTLRSLANGLYEKLAASYPGLLPAVSGSASGHVYRKLFMEWLDDRQGPWAACINLMDAHGPYQPRSEHNRWGDERLRALVDDAPEKWALNCSGGGWWYRRATESLYDGCIHQADSIVEDIVGGLAERGQLEDTLVVVTSDHGEGFGEPSRIRPGVRIAAHNVSIHEVLLHVPLVVKYPGQTSPKRVEQPTSLTWFPDAVRAVIEDDRSADPFVREGPVIAATHGLSDDRHLRERARRFCSESQLESFEGHPRAAYEDMDDGTVRKSMTWNSEAATVIVRNAQDSYKVSTDGAAFVDEAFEGVQDVGVRTAASGLRDLDAQTYRRLQDLGYV